MVIDEDLAMVVFSGLWAGVSYVIEETDAAFGDVSAYGQALESMALVKTVKDLVRPEYHDLVTLSMQQYIRGSESADD